MNSEACRNSAENSCSDLPFSGGTDLHMHSVYSDGTDCPIELIDAVEKAGISFFSLTDHDSADGCDEMKKLASERSLIFTPGIEFSCRSGNRKYHILGYGFDTENSPVTALARERHILRIEKTKNRIRRLREAFGFEFTEVELSSLFALNNPGKPHIASLMVAHGYAETITEAIEKYISACSVSSDNLLSPERAIDAILSSGGIPVLAHGILGDGGEVLDEDELDFRVRELSSHGLRGLEAFYSGFDEHMEAITLQAARRYSLLVSAGSDYHGRIKSVNVGNISVAGADYIRDQIAPFYHAVTGK